MNDLLVREYAKAERDTDCDFCMLNLHHHARAHEQSIYAVRAARREQRIKDYYPDNFAQHGGIGVEPR